MRALKAGVLGLGLMALGCAGLFGYGTELGSSTAQSAKPFSLTYQAVGTEPASLWLDYDVSYTGRDFSVTGPVRASPGGSWSMNLKRDGAPISGARKVLNSSETSSGNKGTSKATIHLVDIPAQSAGTTVTVSGTFTAASNTTLHRLRVVVTD